MEYGSTICGLAVVLGVIGYLTATSGPRTDNNSSPSSRPRWSNRRRLVPLVCSLLIAFLAGMYYFWVDARFSATLVFLGLAASLFILQQ